MHNVVEKLMKVKIRTNHADKSVVVVSTCKPGKPYVGDKHQTVFFYSLTIVLQPHEYAPSLCWSGYQYLYTRWKKIIIVIGFDPQPNIIATYKIGPTSSFFTTATVLYSKKSKYYIHP